MDDSKSKNVEHVKTDRGGTMLIPHGPDREKFGDDARKSAMPDRMKETGLSHSIREGKVRTF